MSPDAELIGNQSPWVLLSTLWRARGWIVISAVASAVLTGAVVMLFPREYKASAAFVPQEPNAAPAGLGAIAAQFGISAPRAMTTSPQFYADLLQSREVLRDVLQSTYQGSEWAKFSGSLLEYLRIKGKGPDETMTRAVKRLQDLLTVKTNRQTGVVSLDVRTRDPEISKQVVQRLLSLVNEYNLKRRQSQGRSEREFTQQRLAEARRDLTESEGALAAFNARNRRFGDFSPLTGEAARLQREVTVNQQLFISLSQSFEAAKIEEVRNTPVITVLERPEGFVEPQSRGTIKKALAAFVIGGFLAALFALVRDFLRRAPALGRRDLDEFFGLLRESWAKTTRRRAESR